MDTRQVGAAWRARLEALADAQVRRLGDELEATGTMAVVLDGDGRIAGCSEVWLEAAAEHGLDRETVGVGADYLAACDAAAATGDHTAKTAAVALRSVLRGDDRQVSLDYECSGPDERRWFTMRAAQLVGPGSGALVTHVDITAVRAAELAVRGELHELWHVVDPSADFVFLLDEHGQVLGRTSDESRPDQWPLTGETAFDFIHLEDRHDLLERFSALASTPGRRETVNLRGRGPGGDGWRHFTVDAVNMADDPAVGGIVAAVVDVSARFRQASASALAAALADEVSVTAVATDDRGIITAINAGACALLGLTREQALGENLRDFVLPVSEDEATVLRETVDEGGEWSGELDVVRTDGTFIPVAMRVRSLEDPATGLRGRTFLALDHSQARRLQTSLQRHRHLDPLTGMANRSAFRNHLSRRVETGQRAVVATIALDRFTDVNALHGTAVGDATLRAVGEALAQVAGPHACVARLYGDVFAATSPPEQQPETFANTLKDAIATVQPTPELAIHISASIGLRFVDHDDVDIDPERIVADAVLAAEWSKRTRSAVQTYDAELRRSVDHEAMLRRDLARALDRDELDVAFQPIVRLQDGVVVGTEALLRWNHPTVGAIPPDIFIPLAEQSPVIHDLGAFVLERACGQASRWHQLRPELPVSVAVNLSASQLADATLADRLNDAITRHHLYPSSILLELTESMLLDLDGGREHLNRLKALGVRLAIDDFGTGYSSLSRLKHMPLDVVKFDRSFITGIGTNPADTSIVRTVASLADAFGVDVVAEGVETPDDAEALLAIGCTLGQGYLWSPPVPAHDIDQLLMRQFAPVPQTRPTEDVATSQAASESLRTIRHELATPLAVLGVALDLREPDGTLAADVVDMVIRNVNRASRAVDDLDLLDLLDHGTLHPDRRDVELAQLVQSVAERLRLASSRVIDVHVIDDVTLSADGSLIDVAVTNVVSNALKYSPHPTPVSVEVSVERGSARVAVCDHGPGIPSDKLGVVWRKFGRLSRTVPGSGIGLYLARGIARAHGGDLNYRSPSGGGSVFVLDLPLGHEHSPA